MSKLYYVVHMSQITMSSTYESNYIWVKLLWVVHMSQIDMSRVNYYVVHMSQIIWVAIESNYAGMSSTYELNWEQYMSSTYESNYYE